MTKQSLPTTARLVATAEFPAAPLPARAGKPMIMGHYVINFQYVFPNLLITDKPLKLLVFLEEPTP